MCAKYWNVGAFGFVYGVAPYIMLHIYCCYVTVRSLLYIIAF